jgi:hypothetical protein
LLQERVVGTAGDQGLVNEMRTVEFIPVTDEASKPAMPDIRIELRPGATVVTVRQGAFCP